MSLDNRQVVQDYGQNGACVVIQVALCCVMFPMIASRGQCLSLDNRQVVQNYGRNGACVVIQVALCCVMCSHDCE